jgi:DNA helicase II / ATP-dependent DNA helicase PcrA
MAEAGANTLIADLQGHHCIADARASARRTNLATALRDLLSAFQSSHFSGDPAADWLRVKRALRATGQAELLRVAAQLDYLVAFQRGHRISAGLASEWLRDGAYSKAQAVLDNALAQEQILDGVDTPSGLQVMNFHKSKGKQFDAVIVVREAQRWGKDLTSSFVWRGDDAPYPKSRRVLRVGITRAQCHTLVLDPLWPPCPLLDGHRL